MTDLVFSKSRQRLSDVLEEQVFTDNDVEGRIDGEVEGVTEDSEDNDFELSSSSRLRYVLARVVETISTI